MSKEDSKIYQVTRVKANEVNLLTNSVLDQIIASPDEQAMLGILKDHGYDTKGSSDSIVKSETNKLWKFISELGLKKSDLSTMLVENDFHNLKVEIKGAYKNVDVSNLYQRYGLVDIEKIKQAVAEKKFSILPDYMQKYAEEAFDVLFKTGDGQLADSIIDKGSLKAMNTFAEKSDLKLLKEYASLRTAIADIKIAIRGVRAGKPKDFFEKYMQETDVISVSSLAHAASITEDEIYSYLEITDFKDAIDMIKNDLTLFEVWCDNKLIDTIKKEKFNSFTLSPVIAYIIARQIEIKNVGILLVAKRNDFSEEEITKRMRDMYV